MSIPLSVMLINTEFSHCNEECSPYFLVITHQTQARDDIDGLMQERGNSIANALEYVFLAPIHPYKECQLCPPPPSCYFLQCNEINMTMPYFFQFYHRSMYWAYSMTLYCIATHREYHIATVKFVIHNHFHHFHYLLPRDGAFDLGLAVSVPLPIVTGIFVLLWFQSRLT